MTTPTIYRDVNEKKPYELVDSSRVLYVPKKLLVGDYATPMQCVTAKANTLMPRFSLERKSISDYLTSWFGGGHAEQKKIFTAQSMSKKLGYQCLFWYVLDGFSTDIRARLNRYPWATWNGGLGLSWDEVRRHMNHLRVKGYRVITCAHKLDAEENVIDILTDYDRVHGAPARRGPTE